MVSFFLSVDLLVFTLQKIIFHVFKMEVFYQDSIYTCDTTNSNKKDKYSHN